ncbi:MAG TPA: ATP-binding protein [Solirubrobacteraceae bacterium]|nr:ATP-binding protein [Solirubrobacteraceae bacterium]
MSASTSTETTGPDRAAAPGAPAATAADLRPIDLFDDLDDATLERWAARATIHTGARGDRIRERGGHDGVVLLLDGRLEMLSLDGDMEAVQGSQYAPTWIGAVPTMLGNPSPIALRAATDVRYARLAPEPFLDLVRVERSVFLRVIGQMKPMLARASQRQQQHDRLESLGTMAAGLAHELNNPASAAQRAAGELAEALGVLSQTIGVFVESGVEREQASRLVALQRDAVERRRSTSALSSLEAADREDELSDALAELGTPSPWELAATLAASGTEPGHVREIGEIAGPLAVPVVRWIGATLAADQLVAELTDSTKRMSDLVIAIKRYAYARPGEIAEVDLREGIETTLTLLKHKLKHTTIEVVRDYDPALPPARVYSSELNQVWTNLLDNAIDALDGSGTITITTRLDGECAEVDIADSGPGIPEPVRRRVFDPFFTTKDVGRGTGLGLDSARRIIVDRHHGSLTVESRTEPPTGTIFRARFPLAGDRS